MLFESKGRKEVVFDNVAPGEVVRYGDQIFLVVEDVNDIAGDVGNVVDISNGMVGLIYADSKVELLNVVLKEV